MANVGGRGSLSRGSLSRGSSVRSSSSLSDKAQKLQEKINELFSSEEKTQADFLMPTVQSSVENNII